MLALNFIIPIVILFIGFILKKKPNKKIGSNGYSTPRSMKSQEAWDYAQILAPEVAINLGKILLIFVVIITVLSLAFNFPTLLIQKVCIGLGIITMFGIFFIVEHKAYSKK